MALPQSKAHRRKPMSHINVVPFIDVMLVLLIIFMVTAPLMQQGVEVELPQADAKPMEEQQRDPIIVTVGREGELTLNQGAQANMPLDRETLGEQVGVLLAGREGDQVYVRGDRNVDYGRVVDAMVVVQAAGAAKVGLITQPAPETRRLPR
ncbi:MAG: protein TolR [Chromatiales bacterium]|jgi:biopolymer transport protein TolR|nr:protein TolR [Chromatiales bacterium]MDX9766478.1 protein TolR [Ectothiorhodospiraceae bacterium]